MFDLLRADNVSFAYPRGRGTEPSAREFTISTVTLTLPRGGIVGILGANGSGKTTLLRLLSGTRRPTSGRVLLDDQPLDRMSRRDAAKRIAVVPQETEVVFDFSVLEMVLMGRHPHLGLFELEGPNDLLIAREMLHATGIADLEHRSFRTLSGGEKQRVVIAAALTQAADILLLDEPTASLDLAYQLEVATLVAELNRTRGVTVAISTHDLNLAASICRDLVLLREGRIVSQGPTEEILTTDNIRALYDVDADVHRHASSGHLVVVPLKRLTQ